MSFLFKSSKEKKELNEAIDAIQSAYEAQVAESKIKEKEINELSRLSEAMKLELSAKELEGAVSRNLLKEQFENEKKLKEKIEESNKEKNKLINKLNNLNQKLQNEKLEKEGYEQLVKLLSLHSIKSEKQAGPSSKPDMSNVDEILKELSLRLKIDNESGDKSKNEHTTGDDAKNETKNKTLDSNESSKDSGKPNSSEPSKPKKNSKPQNTHNVTKELDKKGNKTFKKNNQDEGKHKGSGRPNHQSHEAQPLFNQNQFPHREHQTGLQHPSEFSNSFQQPRPGFNRPHPPRYNNGPYPPPLSGFNGPYPHNPPGYTGPYQSPPSGFNGPYQPPPSGFNGPYQHYPPGYNGPNLPPLPHNGPPFGQNPSLFPPNQMYHPPQSQFGPPPYPGDNSNLKNNDAGSMKVKSNLKEFTHNSVKSHGKDEYSQDGKGNKCDENYKKGKNEDTYKKNKDPEEARGNKNIKGDLFIAKNLWSKLDDMKKKSVESIKSSEMDDLIKEVEQSKIIDKKAFYNELGKIFGGLEDKSGSDSGSNGNDDLTSSRPNNSRRRGNYYQGRGRGGRGRGRGNNHRNFKQYNNDEDDDSDQHSVTSERSNCSRKGGRPYNNRGKPVKSDTGNAYNKSENEEDSDQRSVKSEGGRRGRRPFKAGWRGSNKPRNNFNRQRDTGNVEEKDAVVNSVSGDYAPAEIMNLFMGRNIPALSDALKQKIDVTLKVKDVVVLGPNDNEPVKEIPSTLLDIIFFKKKYPLAVCIPQDL